jgi:hypothetical protein
LISASGYQDHTTSPSTNGAFVACAFAGHRIPQPNVRDDREASLKRVRDGIGLLLFLPKREGKYFFRQGWTGSISLIRFDFSRGRGSGELRVKSRFLEHRNITYRALAASPASATTARRDAHADYPKPVISLSATW